MARSKSKKPKSPHKQQTEERNNKDKTETTPHITPQTSKPNKTTTVVKFMQPSDEDTQGNVLPDDDIERKRAAAAQKTPSKKDSKTAAQSEAEESPLSVEQPRNRLRTRNHELEAMK
jgi:hypothetical protein